jgi:hypothetical protein
MIGQLEKRANARNLKLFVLPTTFFVVSLIIICAFLFKAAIEILIYENEKPFTPKGIHANRTSGRHRHHCDSGGDAAAGPRPREIESHAGRLLEQ